MDQAIATGMESIQLDSSVSQNGVIDPMNDLHSLADRNLNGAEDSINKPAHSVKKKTKKRKNVALLSIEKLSSNHGGCPVTVTNGKSNLDRELDTSVLKNVELPNLRASETMQERPLSARSMNHRRTKHSNSPQLQQEACSGSKHQRGVNHHQTLDQLPACGTTKTKVCIIGMFSLVIYFVPHHYFNHSAY